MAATVVPTTIAIRPLTRADLRRVRRLERAAYGAGNPQTPFERELRNGLARYLVAQVAQGDEVAGEVAQGDAEGSEAPVAAERSGVLARLRRLLLGDGDPSPIVGFAGAWYTHEQLHLVTLATAPERQGEGIGQALLLAVCDLAVAAELDSIALELRASNARAQQLYERFGFRVTGRLSTYYADNGEDAVVMLLEGLAGPEGRAALDRLSAAHRLRFGGRFGRSSS